MTCCEHCRYDSSKHYSPTYICTEMGSCANSAKMFLTFSVHTIFDCECLDIYLVKIHKVIKEISKLLNKLRL